MPLPTLQLITVFLLSISQIPFSFAAPEPAITAAAIIPRKAAARLDKRHDESIRAAISLRNLAARQSKPGMGVCYGQGSICDLYLDMSCPITLEGDEWYKCMCETGYISTKAACQNCDSFYDLGGTNDGARWSSDCSSKGLSVAPIPSNVKSAWSEFNATMTYDTAKSGGGASQTKASSASKTVGGLSDSTTSASKRPLETDDSTGSDSSSSKSSAPYVLGSRTFVDYTVTMGGMPTSLPPVVTPSALPPLALGGPSSQGSGAERQMGRLSSVLVIGATFFAVVCGVIFAL